MAQTVINPRRACAERVTVVVSCVCVCVCVCVSVCMYVCPNTLFWQYAQLEVQRKMPSVKRQICSNIKKAFFLKLPYSKVRASFTHLGRGGHL